MEFSVREISGLMAIVATMDTWRIQGKDQEELKDIVYKVRANSYEKKDGNVFIKPFEIFED